MVGTALLRVVLASVEVDEGAGGRMQKKRSSIRMHCCRVVVASVVLAAVLEAVVGTALLLVVLASVEVDEDADGRM